MSLSGFLDYQRGLLVGGVEASTSEMYRVRRELLSEREIAGVAEYLLIIRETTLNLSDYLATRTNIIISRHYFNLSTGTRHPSMDAS